jgi:hypothetical protein
MASYHTTREWKDWIADLAGVLHGRSAWRLSVLMLGVLFAQGRRVVASWIRAADESGDYRDHYYFLQSVGRRWQAIGMRVVAIVLKVALRDQQRVLLVIDDSPTKRYGPQVQGAGIHHDPTPGPAGTPFCYGHVWVTLALAIRHRLWGTIGLPILAWLYVREKDVEKIAEQHGWNFQTKLEQAADLAVKAAKMLQSSGKDVWLVSDGAYTKQPFVRPLMQQGVTLVGRLRKDSALYSLPPQVKQPGRGRPRIYGKEKISLMKRAGQKRGWQKVVCDVYGKAETKTIKTFLATSKIFGGMIRVVIVMEPHGPQFFYCTDIDANVIEIIESFADRAVIEQVFHDVKEVWGSGQQQVRNIWSSVACWNLNLWMHTLVELWSWDRPAEDLVHREDSPWDDPHRRPSHADKRKALQAACMVEEFRTAQPTGPLPRKIRAVLKRLLGIAV